MIFRKLCQILGLVLFGVGIWFAWNWLLAMLTGDAAIGWGLLGVFLNLAVLSGLGLLFMIFDPHQVIQNYYVSLHRLVEPRNKSRSFADKIGVGEEDD